MRYGVLFRSLGLVSFAVLTALGSGASAQTVTDATITDAPPSDGDIVVTARKRAERAQDIPVQISVSSGEQLQARAITRLDELGQNTPSLVIVPSINSSNSVSLFMRGQSMIDIRLNQDLAIGVYQDGVYLPRAQGANATDLFDLERVEVLAGPQGTLFGKNTSGGVLQIITKTPVDRWEGTAQVRGGSYWEMAANAMVNVPLGEGLAFRAVGSVSSRDGYGTNLLDGRKLGQLFNQSVRGTLRWESGDVTAILRGNYTHSDTTGFATKGSTASPAFTLGDPDDGSLNTFPTDKGHIWGTSLTIDAHLSDDVSIRSITAGNGFRRHSTNDIGGAPTNFLDYPNTRVNDRQLSQELQLLGTAFADNLNWIVGGFASDEKGTEQQIQLTGVSQLQLADIGTRSLGVFAQGTYKLTPELSLTLGGRYSADRRTIDNFLQTLAPFRLCQALGVPIGATTIPGAQVTAADCRRDDKVNFDGFSYTASIDYKIAPDILVYAKTNRGYRSGGLQETGGSTPSGLCVTAPSIGNCANFVAAADVVFAPYKPETVTDYEAGVKSEFFDRRLQVNLTYYHSTLKNAIRTSTTPTPAGIASFLQNAASLKVDGIEWQISLRPVPALSIYTSGAYTDARFSEYITPTGEDRSNIDVLFAPKWQYSVGGSFSQDLGAYRFDLSTNYSFTSRMLSNETVAYVPRHGLLNGRLAVDIDAAGLQVAVFGKNLTNKRYPVFPAQAGTIIITGFYNTPRVFGAEVIKKF